MRSINMNINALYFLTIDIATEMRALIYNKTFFTFLLSTIRKCGSKKTGTHY